MNSQEHKDVRMRKTIFAQIFAQKKIREQKETRKIS